MLFLRQVDDFAVASTNDDINMAIIQAIDKEMEIDIKDLGRMTRYNGVDVTQTKEFIKLSNETYIDKILEDHAWLLHDDHIAAKPSPIKSERDYSRQLETATPPSTESEERKLQLEMGFNYRQAIGKLIYLMVTCHPDISFPLIKLSQYSNKPAQEHYEAVQQIYRYIKATKSDGIHYWRPSPRDDLPTAPLPEIKESNYDNTSMDEVDSPTTMHSAVDADWGGDVSH